jgi:23S rRNA pseudouridine1911/1915/1917 synthase
VVHLKNERSIISAGVLSTAVLDPTLPDVEFAAELPEVELRQLSVPVEGHGERLDRILASMVPEFSRSYLQQLIYSNAVQLNSVVQLKASARVKAGDALTVELRPTAQSQAFKPEVMTLDVVYEDESLLVINKPAGLVVHPAPGNWSGTLLNGLLARDSRAMMLPRAGIVHRLDKDTSGLMVVARTRQAMDRLVQMIAERSVSRQYLALAHHAWQGAKTRHVDFPIGRDPRNRLRMSVVDLDRHAGKLAATDISLLQTGLSHCLVRCKLHTGRTHQIRVHMAAIGHSLVADEVYGGPPAGGLARQALHACALAFAHPITGVPLAFNCPLPSDFAAAIGSVGLSYN